MFRVFFQQFMKKTWTHLGPRQTSMILKVVNGFHSLTLLGIIHLIRWQKFRKN